MGSGKNAGTGMQQVPILIRSDIVKAAEKVNLDISGECNRALAQRLGIVWKPEPERLPASRARVIVAPDGSQAKQSPPAKTMPPVINAEDPSVPGKVLREKKERKPPVPAQPKAPERRPVPPPPATSPKNSRGKSGSSQKGKKEEAIQGFVRIRLARETEEAPDAIIAKDELYEKFEHWCRDQGFVEIPERKPFSVALKNKYAFAERTIGGIPSWVNIRVK